MSREIVFDTETTGLKPETGDRIVEIGAVELANHVPTGRHFHTYLNPERDMPEAAFRVHGLSEEFLADKPRFAEAAGDFLAFVGTATLIAHNAPFDMAFLAAELKAARFPSLNNSVIDTVVLARQKHPGARVSLDALCKHYGVDTSKRTLHGALLDSQILAEVYLELLGGRQVALDLASHAQGAAGTGGRVPAAPRPTPLPPRLDSDQIAAHQAFIAEFGETALWRAYGDFDERG